MHFSFTSNVLKMNPVTASVKLFDYITFMTFGGLTVFILGMIPLAIKDTLLEYK